MQINTEATALGGGRYSTPCWQEMAPFVTLPVPNLICLFITNRAPLQGRVNPGALHGSGMPVAHIYRIHRYNDMNNWSAVEKRVCLLKINLSSCKINDRCRNMIFLCFS